MSLQNRLLDLATRIATEFKALRTLTNGNAADLSALNTTAKSNLVVAINEVRALAAAAAGSGGAAIDDGATGSATTWSSERIAQEIGGALDDLAAGAPGALDTLAELAAALGNDANFAATVTTALGARVRTDTGTQGLTAPQQANARANIGAVASADIGNPETDFVATFNTGLL